MEHHQSSEIPFCASFWLLPTHSSLNITTILTSSTRDWCLLLNFYRQNHAVCTPLWLVFLTQGYFCESHIEVPSISSFFSHCYIIFHFVTYHSLFILPSLNGYSSLNNSFWVLSIMNKLFNIPVPDFCVHISVEYIL